MEKNKEEKVNWPIIGNNHITLFLDKLLSKKSIHGNFIITGPDNIGKTSVALYFIKILFCTNANDHACESCNSCLNINKYIVNKNNEESVLHPDISIVQKEEEKKNISIEQIRVMIKSLNMSSFLNSYKVGIIRDADSLSIEASNALLKTLEEPKKNVLMFLIATNIEKLPKTVISRCQVLNFHPVSSKLIYDYLINNLNASRDKAKQISRLCFGRPALAAKYLDDEENFNKYLNDIEIFINFFSLNTNERLNSLNTNLNIGSGQIAVGKARKILKNWQGVLRDLLLHELGQSSLAYNVDIEKISHNANESNSINYLLSINKAINHSIECIEGNVNPKIALNNLALSF